MSTPLASTSIVKKSTATDKEETDTVSALPTRRTIQAAITKRGSKADKAKDRQIAALESHLKIMEHAREFQCVLVEHYKLEFAASQKSLEREKKQVEKLSEQVKSYERREKETTEASTQTN